MKLHLTIWERIQLCIIVGSLKGVNMTTIRKADKALDILELSPEEEGEIGMVRLPGGDIRWKPNVDLTFDLEIKEREAAHLVKKSFQEYSGWNSRDRKLILELEKKLGLAPKEEVKEDADARDNP